MAQSYRPRKIEIVPHDAGYAILIAGRQVTTASTRRDCDAFVAGYRETERANYFASDLRELTDALTFALMYADKLSADHGRTRLLDEIEDRLRDAQRYLSDLRQLSGKEG